MPDVITQQISTATDAQVWLAAPDERPPPVEPIECPERFWVRNLRKSAT